jgi:hypothetical protein
VNEMLLDMDRIETSFIDNKSMATWPSFTLTQEQKKAMEKHSK